MGVLIPENSSLAKVHLKALSRPGMLSAPYGKGAKSKDKQAGTDATLTRDHKESVDW